MTKPPRMKISTYSTASFLLKPREITLSDCCIGSFYRNGQNEDYLILRHRVK